MAYEQKPNQGVLFKNEKKTTDKHPDYTGTFTDANGTLMNLAAWVKEGQKGKFFSVQVSERKAKSNNDLPF